MTKQEHSDPQAQGFNAFLEHGNDAINPYPDESNEHLSWGAGFRKAQVAMYSEME